MRYEGVKSVPPPNHHDLGAPGTSTVEIIAYENYGPQFITMNNILVDKLNAS
jgi:hypothetical protein